MSFLDYTVNNNIINNNIENVITKTSKIDIETIKSIPDVPYVENSPEYNNLPFTSNGLLYNIQDIIPSVEINDNIYLLNVVRSSIPPPEKTYSLSPEKTYGSSLTGFKVSNYPPSLDCFKAIGYDNPVRNEFNSEAQVGRTPYSVSESIAIMNQYQAYVKYNEKIIFNSYFLYDHNGQKYIKDTDIIKTPEGVLGGCPWIATNWQSLQNGLAVLQNIGSCPVQNYDRPFTPDIYKIASKYKIESYANIYMKGSYSSDANTLIDTIKRALYLHGPSLIAIHAYNQYGICVFEDTKSNRMCWDKDGNHAGDGRIWDSRTVDCHPGITCMLIVGYDINNGFLLLNNWGKNWPGKYVNPPCPPGHTWLPYSEILHSGILEIWTTTDLFSIAPRPKLVNYNLLYILLIIPVLILIIICYIYKSQISKFLKLYKIS
jgi:hypothetical protein